MSHRCPDLSQIEYLTHAVPYRWPRLASHTRRCIVVRKQFQGLVAPKQLDQRTRILVGILIGGPKRIKQRSLDATADQEHTPPPGNELEASLDVLGPNNKGDAVEDAAVRLNLGGQPTQPVPIRLDLVAMKHTTNRREVNPSPPLAKSQLLDHYWIWTRKVLLVEIRPKHRSHPDVPVYGLLGRTRPGGRNHRPTTWVAVCHSLGDTFENEVRIPLFAAVRHAEIVEWLRLSLAEPLASRLRFRNRRTDLLL